MINMLNNRNKNLMKDNQFKFSLSVFALPLIFLLAMWLVFWTERKFNIELTSYGIYPRNFDGLIGIFCAPFLHGNFEHLLNNSIPIVVLIAALRYFYRKQSLQILFFGIIVSGFLTWVIGRQNHHIGASTLIYLLASFMFFKGIQSKYYRLVAVSLLVVLLYGSLVWYIFPGVDEKISWEGHLSGFVTGLGFSFLVKTPNYQKALLFDWQQPTYDASQDKFMQRFDENGNFVNPPAPQVEPDLQETKPYFNSNLPVVYTIVSKNEN
jgi:membrane associated rhomboid family serine protease